MLMEKAIVNRNAAHHAGAGLVKKNGARAAHERDAQRQLALAAAAVLPSRATRHLCRQRSCAQHLCHLPVHTRFRHALQASSGFNFLKCQEPGYKLLRSSSLRLLPPLYCPAWHPAISAGSTVARSIAATPRGTCSSGTP